MLEHERTNVRCDPKKYVYIFNLFNFSPNIILLWKKNLRKDPLGT